MKTTKLLKAPYDKTTFTCECGTPVVDAFFDELGYLHTSSVEVCPKCGCIVDEELLNEEDVEIIN